MWPSQTSPHLHPAQQAYLDGVLADTQGVPQLDGLVPRARHDLAVVGREGHAEDVLGVSHEAAGGGAAGGGGESTVMGGIPYLKHTLLAKTVHQKMIRYVEVKLST